MSTSQMRAGKLNNHIQIWNPTIAAGTEGNAGATIWTWVGEIWGSLDGLSSREAFERGAIGSTSTHKINCRYTTLINSQSKLFIGTREFRVDGAPIDPTGRRRELLLNVVEKVT